MRRAVPDGGRLVVKIGSSSLLDGRGYLDDGAVGHVATQVASSWREGRPTVLVTSGAVAAGLSTLGLESRPRDLPGLQVAAAVGQGRLMQRYADAFESLGLVAGQVLLTRDVLANRDQYLHARQALGRMLAGGIVPVINENDTVVIDELRLGDNDRLGAIVSHLVGADMLVILTDSDGLFSSDPRLGEAEFLAAVHHADTRLDALSGAGPLGSGGVASKVVAARMAAWSGIPTVIAAASSSLGDIAHGADVGTWVDPHPQPLPARKLWIAFGQPVAGTVTIDDGAVAALVDRGTSLLPVGIADVEGAFDVGDTLDVRALTGRVVARGLARMDSTELLATIGRRGASETIHRDDLVVFGRA